MNEVYPVAEQIFRNLQTRAYRGSILCIGPASKQRKDWLIRSCQLLLNTDQLRDHPDYYYFSSKKVALGSSSKPEQGSVRHFLQHFVPYPPRKSTQKIAIFPAAEKLLAEAESALLKTIEEPPDYLTILLVVEEISQLRDTIVSRCLQVPLQRMINSAEVSQDPWQRFWYLSGADFSQLLSVSYEQVQAKIQDIYSRIQYRPSDSIYLDELSPEMLKKQFPKFSQDQFIEIMQLGILPLEFMCRDALFEGQVPTIAPERLPWKSTNVILHLYRACSNFRMKVRHKVFKTRSLNLGLLFTQVLQEFEICASQATDAESPG